jgi:hypothetical protein
VYARGSLAYTVTDVTVDLTASTSIIPAPLTGQVMRAHQGTLHGAAPISSHRRLFAAASIGYLHGDIVDRVNLANNQTFDTLLADVDLSWQVRPLVSLFARYQFVAQITETNQLGFNPSILRDMVLFGVLLSSRPPEASGSAWTDPAGPTRLPQRVDRSDAPPQAGGTGTEPNRNPEPERPATPVEAPRTPPPAEEER